MDDLLTPKDVCTQLHISIHTLYKWTSLRLIPFVKVGSLLRFRKVDIEGRDNSKASLGEVYAPLV